MCPLDFGTGRQWQWTGEPNGTLICIDNSTSLQYCNVTDILAFGCIGMTHIKLTNDIYYSVLDDFLVNSYKQKITVFNPFGGTVLYFGTLS